MLVPSDEFSYEKSGLTVKENHRRGGLKSKRDKKLRLFYSQLLIFDQKIIGAYHFNFAFKFSEKMGVVLNLNAK